MSVLIVLSTLAMGLGLYITWLVHGRSDLDIVVESRSNQDAYSSTGELPLISVIVPARNEGRNIRCCAGVVPPNLSQLRAHRGR